jgi:hypothetical protein
MPYYDTLEEDIARAKQLLAKGKAEPFMLGEHLQLPDGGTIFGADIFAAYKLLESFVAELASQEGQRTASRGERRSQLQEFNRVITNGWAPITTKAECEQRYGDRNLADKLPRGVLYLDIGFLMGTVERLRAELAATVRRQRRRKRA